VSCGKNIQCSGQKEKHDDHFYHSIEQIFLLNVKNLISVGTKAVLHIHQLTVEVKFRALVALIDRRTGTESKKNPPFLCQDQMAIVQLELSQANQLISIDTYQRSPSLARFTLRNSETTIAMGKILRLIN
jgi:peptide chain release factor subunit 3